MNQITTTDNNCGKTLAGINGTQEDYNNLCNIGNIPIDDLIKENPRLLVFPHSLNVNPDKSYDKNIFDIHGSIDNFDKISLSTGNVVGFVGYRNTHLSIRSRFQKNQDYDYFLHYMLQKVFLPNIFDLPHSTNNGDVFDFLLYLFPLYLKNALAQGLYKTYQRFERNDDRIKGVIDIPRHIRQNIPFAGKVAYNSRESSYDNNITELIRHTIEYIKTKSHGKTILSSDTETQSYVKQIIDATPLYSIQNRQKIISKNIKPFNHPFYSAYKPLQKLCMMILCHKKLNYDVSEKEVYGILFDGAWLWEEYLATILTKCGFKHPRNKDSKGGIRMFATDKDENEFDKNYRRIYPDFYRTAHSNNPMILDAKYKRLQNGVERDDLYQIVTYMHTMKIQSGGFIFPCETQETHSQKYGLAGYGGEISVIGFPIPQNDSSYNDFVDYMKTAEEDLKNRIN